jgi:hypothetical protein
VHLLNPADSLKLRAAEFLIVNMPGKYSEYYDAPWNDVATVHLRWTSSSDKQMVMDTYKLGKSVKQDDVKYITAEYLINNIDLAFKVWQETPWGKYVPFDAFCEEILPYRVSTEPLENWREKALASFADPYNGFLKNENITAVEACSRINDLLPRCKIDKDFPPMTYTQLMATAKGTCDNITSMVSGCLGRNRYGQHSRLIAPMLSQHTVGAMSDTGFAGMLQITTRISARQSMSKKCGLIYMFGSKFLNN